MFTCLLHPHRLYADALCALSRSIGDSWRLTVLLDRAGWRWWGGGCQSRGGRPGRGVSKSRWTSWAPVPNKPTVSVDVKQHSTSQPTCPREVIAEPTATTARIRTCLYHPLLHARGFKGGTWNPLQEEEKERRKLLFNAQPTMTVISWRQKKTGRRPFFLVFFFSELRSCARVEVDVLG